jgi:uncharacterized protein
LTDIDDYISFIHDEFGNDERFECYFRPAGNWGGERVDGLENELISSFDELYRPLLHNISKINVNAYIPLLKVNICTAGHKNSYVLGSDGTIYKCTMLFNEEFNKIGKITTAGKMDINYYKFAKWVTPVTDANEICGVCNVWYLCHNRNCPAKAFLKQGMGFVNCGYEKKSLDYVLRFLDAAGSKHIKNY